MLVWLLFLSNSLFDHLSSFIFLLLVHFFYSLSSHAALSAYCRFISSAKKDENIQEAMQYLLDHLMEQEGCNKAAEMAAGEEGKPDGEERQPRTIKLGNPTKLEAEMMKKDNCC